MRISIFGKYPPIQGGVSRLTFLTAQSLVKQHVAVDVITNAMEAPLGYRQCLMADDIQALCPREGLTVQSTKPIKDRHIPYANPFVSKLVGLGVDVARQRRPDLIVGWYWEPYGMAATVVGQLLDIPVALMHAGSDLGRLAQQPQLSTTYALCLEKARYVVTGRHSEAQSALDALGVAQEKRVLTSRRSLPDIHYDTSEKIDFSMLMTQAKDYFDKLLDNSADRDRIATMFAREIPPEVPVIGIYGKMGDAKGTFELIEALDRVAAEGTEFHLIYLAAGERWQFRQVFDHLSKHSRVEQRSWILPPVAPWQIPRFLKACDAACFLENRFPISLHTPGVPNEILASGTALICSEEIVMKLPLRHSLVDGKNVIVVPDPREIDSFANILKLAMSDRQRLRSIGRHGRQVVDSLRTHDGTDHVLSNLLRRFRHDLLGGLAA